MALTASRPAILQNAKTFGRTLQSSDAELVLASHDHDYERFGMLLLQRKRQLQRSRCGAALCH
ncbi:hypothetical protein ASE07_14435 [Noviherbaspirillum sp. Root189]|nr:hypothetical protein ASE07_14435 [Noviherbaspirillum sp. Root189]